MRAVFPALVLLLATASGAFSQTATALITGTVFDQSGAGIPDAAVTVGNLETGLVRQTKTDSSGNFVVTLLPPGAYQVAAVKTGFQEVLRKGVLLNVNQAARIDLTLPVGTAAEKIEVVAPAGLTETQSATLGQVIESRRIVDLPMNGRNPMELARLAAGVRLLESSFLDLTNFNLTSVSINGGQGGANAVLIDGGSVTLANRNEYAVMPNVDTIQEFKVHVNSYSAEFGMSSGGVISMVTRSGANVFHGNAYEFLRNDKLDANGWTNNSRNVSRRALRYNQFGGVLGGPVLLPKYNGRNKTFFFFNYEAIRNRSIATQLARVPTELERRGDFSQSIVRNVVNREFVPVTIYDPATTRANPAGSGFVRTPFPSPVLPASRLDRTAASAVKYYPAPNRPPDDPTGTNNFVAVPSSFANIGQFTLRLDHSFSDANRLSGRITRNTIENPGLLPTFGLDNIADPSGSLQKRPSLNVNLSDTHVISPRWMNVATVNVNRQSLRSLPTGFGLDYTSLLGLPATVPAPVFPSFSIGGLTSIGNSGNQLALRGNTVWQGTNMASFSSGRHSLKLGADVRSSFLNNYQPGPAVAGSYSFGGGITSDPQRPGSPTGFGPASFLLGTVEGGSLGIGIAYALNYQYYSGFTQYDFRVLPRLTLNLGLRYELIKPFTERFDRVTTFNPNAVNPVTRTNGVVEYATVEFGRANPQLNKANFAPRFGFAFDALGAGKLVVRGGFGITYYHGAWDEMPWFEGYSATTAFTNPAGPYPAFQLSQGPPLINQPVGRSQGPRLRLGDSVRIDERVNPTPSAQQWNFGIQAQPAEGLIAEVSYAGNHGLHQIAAGYDYNALDPQYLSLGLALDDRVPNPYSAVMPAGAPLSAATVSRSQSLRAYPTYVATTVNLPHMGNTNYHSVFVRVEKRFSSGLTVLGSFTGSKLIGDTGRNLINFTASEQGNVGCGQNAKYDRRGCRAIDPQDVPRNLVVSGVYELPFGARKRFLSQGGPLSHVVGGWQVNGILSARSGQPLVIRGANNRAADRPNALRSAFLPADQRTVQRWFDTSVFVNPPLFTFGNTPNTLPGVRGPGSLSCDFSVIRNIELTERTSLQLRGEFFNVTNRVNFRQPNTTFGSGSFGQITQAWDPRRVQLGLKLSF